MMNKNGMMINHIKNIKKMNNAKADVIKKYHFNTGMV